MPSVLFAVTLTFHSIIQARNAQADFHSPLWKHFNHLRKGLSHTADVFCKLKRIWRCLAVSKTIPWLIRGLMREQDLQYNMTYNTNWRKATWLDLNQRFKYILCHVCLLSLLDRKTTKGFGDNLHLLFCSYTKTLWIKLWNKSKWQ